jgi:hypothetical protein
MKLVGNLYLQQTIGKLVKDIYAGKKSAEVDPSKIEKGEDVKKNFKYLSKTIEKFTKAVSYPIIIISLLYR